jgi:hypothetical protein
MRVEVARVAAAAAVASEFHDSKQKCARQSSASEAMRTLVTGKTSWAFGGLRIEHPEKERT